MPETISNVEIAHRIHEQGHSGSGSHSSRSAWIEILEAVVLAAVAVLTAWSGYQAARWDGKSAASYSLASRSTVRAQDQRVLAGQETLYDISAFNAWVEARAHGDENLMAIFERRFRPEYAVAFAAWLKTDPFHDPTAPPGPIFMPEYKSALSDKAKQMTEEATAHFEKGVTAREAGDAYVRITVVLATVLLLTALGQRFRIQGARVGLLAVAAVMLAVAMFWIATFPHA
jgi:hypothetical protein